MSASGRGGQVLGSNALSKFLHTEKKRRVPVLRQNTFMLIFFLGAVLAGNAATLSISMSSPLYNGSLGVTYDIQLQATGGSGAPYTWSLSSGSLPPGLTLSSSGRISGTPTSSKTYTFSVKVMDVGGSAQTKSVSLTVFSTAADNRYCNSGNLVNFAGSKSDGLANLPASCFFTALSATPSPGTVTTVPAGADLQRYLDGAVCGETLMLTAGASYQNINGLTFSAKHCDDRHWITVRTNASNSQLPREGVRITPCWAKIASLSGRPAYGCPSGGVPSSDRLAKITVSPGSVPISISGDHYRLIGIEITRTAGGGITDTLVRTTGASQIVFDRMWIHGTARDEAAHGISMNDAHKIAVIDSYFNDFHCIVTTGSCTDAQTLIAGSDGTSGGTYKVVNNFLEAAGENILLGGGASVDTPGDFEIRRNHFYKPMLWNPADPSYFGTKFVVKNHFEMKNGTRVLLEGNIMENVWGGFSQVGTHILLTPKSQVSGSKNLCPHCFVTHVTIRYNHMISGAQGLQIADIANDNGVYAAAGNSYTVHDNLFENLVYRNCYRCTNYYNQISTGLKAPSTAVLKSVLLRHNTFVVATSAENTTANAGMLELGGPKTTLQANLRVEDNIFVAGYYGPWSTGGTGNCATDQVGPLGKFTACWSPYSFTGNLIPGGMSIHQTTSWPSGNNHPGNQTSVEYVNLKGGLGGDYHLSSGSPYKRTAKDGTDPGDNIDALNSFVANVN